VSVLADDLVLALVEHGPCPGTQLVRIVKTRKAVVLAELRARACFERVGRGRASLWRLRGTGWEPHRHDASARLMLGVVERLERLESRLDAFERREFLITKRRNGAVS
jgi:hypothetical protein